MAQIVDARLSAGASLAHTNPASQRSEIAPGIMARHRPSMGRNKDPIHRTSPRLLSEEPIPTLLVSAELPKR
jgi:hypothetical protein